MLHLQPLLHDEQCTNDDVIFQPKLHLQQTFLLLCLEPYKHPKTIKLNPNTPWMKQNYYFLKTLIIIFSYFPWIILDSWKFNTFINSCVWLILVDFWSQFLTSYVIFNCRAYVERVDQIIFCKFSSFFRLWCYILKHISHA